MTLLHIHSLHPARWQNRAQVQLKYKLLIDAAPLLNILTEHMVYHYLLATKVAGDKNDYSLFSLYLNCYNRE